MSEEVKLARKLLTVKILAIYNREDFDYRTESEAYYKSLGLIEGVELYLGEKTHLLTGLEGLYSDSPSLRESALKFFYSIL